MMLLVQYVCVAKRQHIFKHRTMEREEIWRRHTNACRLPHARKEWGRHGHKHRWGNDQESGAETDDGEAELDVPRHGPKMHRHVIRLNWNEWLVFNHCGDQLERNEGKMYSLKGCKGSNIQGSAQLADAGPDIRGSVRFGRELKFPLRKITRGRNLLKKLI